MLVDSVEITIRAGSGGDGVVAWRREKYVPKGGPAGGDGGRGGSVYFIASSNLDTLSDFRYKKVFSAENGTNGGSKKLYGAAGKDLVLQVPLGTVIYDRSNGSIIADLVQDNEKVRIARGGKGGLGNVHFATATHQRPEESTKGETGQIREVRLELHYIADLAFIGFPNAGKSSLLNSLTDAHSRIGEYAFSTTRPVLGVLKAGKDKVVLIDLPGLIEGAHEGKGLGLEFLQHAQRVKGLIHVIDGTDPKSSQKIDLIVKELNSYDSALEKLPRILVVNKIDLLTTKELTAVKKRYPKALFVSAHHQESLKPLVNAIISMTS